MKEKHVLIFLSKANACHSYYVGISSENRLFMQEKCALFKSVLFMRLMT